MQKGDVLPNEQIKKPFHNSLNKNHFKSSEKHFSNMTFFHSSVLLHVSLDHLQQAVSLQETILCPLSNDLFFSFKSFIIGYDGAKIDKKMDEEGMFKSQMEQYLWSPSLQEKHQENEIYALKIHQLRANNEWISFEKIKKKIEKCCQSPIIVPCVGVSFARNCYLHRKNLFEMKYQRGWF